MTGRARCALAKGRATAAEIEKFMVGYAAELAAWKASHLVVLQHEIIEGAPARIH